MTDNIDIILPDYFKVKMGNFQYDIDTESLIASLTHQFISKNTNSDNFQSYDTIFNIAKVEITEYLEHLFKNNNDSIDLFGDWIDDFKLFHAEKNKPICRDLMFEFSDNSKWSIKVLDLLAFKSDDNEFELDFDDEMLKNDDELLSWVNSLNWSDIQHLAEEVEKPEPIIDYENEWKSCNKNLVFWEDTLNLLDFFEIDDTISEEASDDQPL